MTDAETMVKSSFCWLELANYTDAPTDTDADRRGLAFIGGVLKYWNGSSFATISGSGGISSWDELYDNDKTLTVDSTGLTFLLTHATNVMLTLQANGGAAGALLAFSNSGS